MSEPVFRAKAPSNIALIKYMGKKDASANLPENGSVSMTLDALCTLAELRVGSFAGAGWIPEKPRGAESAFAVPTLSEAGAAKILRHVERTRQAARQILPARGLRLSAWAEGSAPGGSDFSLRTANSFPQGSGIASSASSFAAVTLVTAQACAAAPEEFRRAWSSDPELKLLFARVSRQGSGSSCRSLGGPWIEWEGERVSEIPSRLPELVHFVVLVSEEEKAVSSSQAHLLVKSSPLWQGRVERVSERLSRIVPAIAAGDLAEVSRIAWGEAWEMHSLFHTASDPFSYWQPGTMRVLQALRPFMLPSTQTPEAAPPIVTMDAGPNVHVTVVASAAAVWEARLRELGFRVLRDRPGRGAEVLS